MCAARDEGDVGSRLRQRRAKSATNPAGTDNRNTHGVFLRFNGQVIEARHPPLTGGGLAPAYRMQLRGKRQSRKSAGLLAAPGTELR
jgi:hypothetical protein